MDFERKVRKSCTYTLEIQQLGGDMYSRSDLEKIDKDIARLRCGERVRSASYGDQKVSYTDVTMSELLQLRREMKRELKLMDLQITKRLIFASHKGLL